MRTKPSEGGDADLTEKRPSVRDARRIRADEPPVDTPPVGEVPAG